MDKDIKDYREKELKIYVIGNIILILIGIGFVDSIVSAIGKKKIWDVAGVVVSSGAVSSLVYIYTYIIDALIPGDVKNKIIWWRKGLPGNRVFSEIKKKNKDTRFTAKEVMDKYNVVYENIDDKTEAERNRIENSAWYGAYQRNENSAQVYISNRDWLLCRDMCVVTLWVLAGIFFVFCAFKICIPCWLVLVVLAELVAMWIAARIKSKRFVYNVIAKDVHKKLDV